MSFQTRPRPSWRPDSSDSRFELPVFSIISTRLIPIPFVDPPNASLRHRLTTLISSYLDPTPTSNQNHASRPTFTRQDAMPDFYIFMHAHVPSSTFHHSMPGRCSPSAQGSSQTGDRLRLKPSPGLAVSTTAEPEALCSTPPAPGDEPRGVVHGSLISPTDRPPRSGHAPTNTFVQRRVR